MKEFKTAAILTFSLVVLGTAAFALYSVQQYLPTIGIILLVLLVAGAVLLLVYGVAHVHQKLSKYEHIQISQYGSVLHRRNQIIEVAPHFAPKATRYVEADEEPLEEMPALMPAMLSFSQLLERGVIQSALADGQMLLGYVAGTQELRYGSWLDLYSCGIGGVSGSGKSTTVRFLLFQAVLANAKLIMIDPHIDEVEESLAAQFQTFPGVHQLPPCNNNPVPVEKRVKWLAKEYLRREKLGIKGPPLVLVIDELNELMRHASDELKASIAKLLLDIAQGGRKFGIFAMLLGQRWSEQDLGGKNVGAAIRSSLASKLIHRFGDEGQAKLIAGGKHGPKCLELTKGHWLFADTGGNFTEMVTPATFSEDGAAIAQILMGVPASASTSKRQFPTSIATSVASLRLLPGIEDSSEDALEDAGTDAPGDVATEPLTPEAYRVLSMLRDKRGQNEIIEEIWGMKSSDGRPYRTAVEEYRSVLAVLASRIGA